jgi:hypothetical protein
MKTLHKLAFMGIMVVVISLFTVQTVMATNDAGLPVQRHCLSSEQSEDTSIYSAPMRLIDCDLSVPPLDLDKLAELVPTTPEDAESKIPPRGGRFILWTHDGVHVVWGRYGNGFFVGTDNQGIRIWGIYYQNTFAGFYGDQLFWGRYCHGRWIAVNLFNQHMATGEYRLFPYLPPLATVDEAIA